MTFGEQDEYPGATLAGPRATVTEGRPTCVGVAGGNVVRLSNPVQCWRIEVESTKEERQTVRTDAPVEGQQRWS